MAAAHCAEVPRYRPGVRQQLAGNRAKHQPVYTTRWETFALYINGEVVMLAELRLCKVESHTVGAADP